MEGLIRSRSVQSRVIKSVGRSNVFARLDRVALMAKGFNVAVRVLATERERLHMVHVHHVHHVREDERAAPGTSGTTTGTDEGTEPSGPLPPTQGNRASGRGPQGLTPRRGHLEGRSEALSPYRPEAVA